MSKHYLYGSPWEARSSLKEITDRECPHEEKKSHYRKNFIGHISTFFFLICCKSRKPKRVL